MLLLKEATDTNQSDISGHCYFVAAEIIFSQKQYSTAKANFELAKKSYLNYINQNNGGENTISGLKLEVVKANLCFVGRYINFLNSNWILSQQPQ